MSELEKELYKKQVENCFCLPVINQYEATIALIMKDEKALEEMRLKIEAKRFRCNMYKAQIDAAETQEQIDKILGSVTLE